MPGFCGGEVAEELACAGVRRPAGSRHIEIPSLALHIHRFLTDAIEAQVLNQPYRPSREKVRHMLATQRYDELAEAMPIRLDQPATVLVLFRGHAVKDRGRCRVFTAQLGRIGGIDAPILLL